MLIIKFYFQAAGDFEILPETADCIGGDYTISIKCILGPCTYNDEQLNTNDVKAGVVCTNVNNAFCGGKKVWATKTINIYSFVKATFAEAFDTN